jgi:hypothetical protein
MKIALLILGSLFSTCSFAQIYKCTDENGKTDYQSKACDKQDNAVQIDIKPRSTIDNSDQKKQNELLKKKEQDGKLEKGRLLQKQATLSESAKNQFLVKNNPEKFSAFSILPYDLDHLPELVSVYQNRLPDIERLRRFAAEKALATERCIRVEASELHNKSTRKTLVFLVNCSSGNFFYFTEHELSSSRSITPP